MVRQRQVRGRLGDWVDACSEMVTLLQSVRTPRVSLGAARKLERRREHAVFTPSSFASSFAFRRCWKNGVLDRMAPTSCSGPSAWQCQVG